MGYTHYWTQTRDFTPEEMGDIAGAVRKIIAEASGKPGVHNYDDRPPVPLVICGSDGTGEPVLTKEKIAFNGQGPDLDHETFYIEATREAPYAGGQLGWAFCKTAQKPYDVVVTAVLTMLATTYGFRVSSDGDIEDWQAGIELAERAVGREFANPLVITMLLGEDA